MVALQLKGIVQQDGTLVLHLPPGISPGVHELVVVLPHDAPSEDRPEANGGQGSVRKLEPATYPIGLVDDSFSFRRRDLYDDQL